METSVQGECQDSLSVKSDFSLKMSVNSKVCISLVQCTNRVVVTFPTAVLHFFFFFAFWYFCDLHVKQLRVHLITH